WWDSWDRVWRLVRKAALQFQELALVEAPGQSPDTKTGKGCKNGERNEAQKLCGHKIGNVGRGIDFPEQCVQRDMQYIDNVTVFSKFAQHRMGQEHEAPTLGRQQDDAAKQNIRNGVAHALHDVILDLQSPVGPTEN